MSNLELTKLHLEDKQTQIARDLAELEEQATAGEIDEAKAAQLRATYERERAETARAIDDLASAPAAPGTSASRRRLLGAGLLIAGVAVVVFGVTRSIAPRAEGELVTGGITGQVAESGGVDLSQVTNEEMEAVVAENPDVPGMRIALARRYFEEGSYRQAMDHYFYLLDNAEPNYEVLANVGWITFLSDEPEVAERYEQRALELEPDFAQAYWYLANIRLYGLEDPAGAVVALESLLSFDSLPPEVADEARALLEQAEAARP